MNTTIKEYISKFLDKKPSISESIFDDEDTLLDPKKDITLVLNTIRDKKLIYSTDFNHTDNYTAKYSKDEQCLSILVDTEDVFITKFEELEELFKDFGLGLKKIYCNGDLSFENCKYVRDIEIEFDWCVSFQNVKEVSDISVRTKNNLRNIHIYNEFTTKGNSTTYKNIKSLNSKHSKVLFHVYNMLPKLINCECIDTITVDLTSSNEVTKSISKMYNKFPLAKTNEFRSFLAACKKIATNQPEIIDDGKIRIWKGSLLDLFGASGIKGSATIDMHIFAINRRVHIEVRKESGSQTTTLYATGM